jgi:hypothetical protein
MNIRWRTAIRQAAGIRGLVKLPDHNAVQHDFLLHLLLFISRSSGTLRSMICPVVSSGRSGIAPLECGFIAAKPLALAFTVLAGFSRHALNLPGDKYVAPNGFCPCIIVLHRSRGRPCR